MKKLRSMNLTKFSLWIGLTFAGQVWGWVLKEMLPGTRKAGRERQKGEPVCEEVLSHAIEGRHLSR